MYQANIIAPKSALRAWIEGVRDEVLMPIAEREHNRLGAAADGFGQESVALLAALEVPYANHPQWVLGFDAGRKAQKKEASRANDVADKIIADYKEHYSFPPQGENHMHDCIMMALEP